MSYGAMARIISIAIIMMRDQPRPPFYSPCHSMSELVLLAKPELCRPHKGFGANEHRDPPLCEADWAAAHIVKDAVDINPIVALTLHVAAIQ